MRLKKGVDTEIEKGRLGRYSERGECGGREVGEVGISGGRSYFFESGVVRGVIGRRLRSIFRFSIDEGLVVFGRSRLGGSVGVVEFGGSGFRREKLERYWR